MTNSITELGQDIRQFVVSNFLFGVEDDGLCDDASFLQTGIIDSTGILELVSYLEETYGITVEDEEMLPENLDSLRQVSAFLKRKLSLQ